MFQNSASRKALDQAAAKLGRTDWYLVLHYFRFLKTLNLVNKYSPGRQLLEIGVWPGYLATAFENLGYKITGLDLDPGRLAPQNPAVSKIDLNHEALNFAPDSFDVVTLTEVLEHLQPQRLAVILAEIKKVLKPEGVLIVTTPNLRRLGSFFNSSRSGADLHGHGHQKEYVLTELLEFAAEAGFKIEQAATISFYSGVGKFATNRYFYPLAGFLRYRQKLRNIFKILAYPFLKFIPGLRDSIYLVLRK